MRSLLCWGKQPSPIPHYHPNTCAGRGRAARAAAGHLPLQPSGHGQVRMAMPPNPRRFCCDTSAAHGSGCCPGTAAFRILSHAVLPPLWLTRSVLLAQERLIAGILPNSSSRPEVCPSRSQCCSDHVGVLHRSGMYLDHKGVLHVHDSQVWEGVCSFDCSQRCWRSVLS